MPMFDFVCPKCGARFEELVFGDDNPACPQCGHAPTERQMSIPSPLKTGAFPYPPKPGAVHPLAAKMMGGGQPSPGCGGQCATCPSAGGGN
ncbi:MAG: zinc ribbon domain-containing protein [Desulfovibrionaceae bacterium]|nr:zinc ribbon domain-containing protein [Desulfovibrionaceae bacterium]